jgi:hypothetical protein
VYFARGWHCLDDTRTYSVLEARMWKSTSWFQKSPNRFDSFRNAIVISTTWKSVVIVVSVSPGGRHALRFCRAGRNVWSLSSVHAEYIMVGKMQFAKE